ncbi:MAG: hypothetical protein EOP49_15175 [Sphingobacteriales bacterium]|nr:MAG: hypothetical protein EOP49_15175 [Sphingobacteriales bacterium]
MISQGEVKRKYEKLMKDVATNDFYKVDLTNRVNCYQCKCEHITKTKDVDAGVTPFMKRCEKCNDFAQSTMYRDIAPHLQPTVEWYRPTLEECYKLKSKPGLIDHILQGGLMDRKITAVEVSKRMDQEAAGS